MGSEALLIRYLVIVAHRLDSFRWVSRWPAALHGEFLKHVRNAAPDKLGTALDETLSQGLRDIPEERNQLALLLFKCLVACFRQLTFKELGDIFATDSELGLDPTHNTQEAVRSACPTSIAVVDEDSKTVQFSSSEVKEFLTSNRLPTLYPNISKYHISPETAHAALSRACINLLLGLGDTADKANIDSPLFSYAVQYWVEHTQFGDVASQNQTVMEHLFNPNKRHLAWIWMRDVDRGRNAKVDDCPPNPLYYAAFYGFNGLVKHLITQHPQLLNAKGGYYGTPLHAASYKGHVEAMTELIEAKPGADVKATNGTNSKTPLHAAYYGGGRRRRHAMDLLLENGAEVDAKDSSENTLLHQASLDGQEDVVELLLKHGADADAKNRKHWTPLHGAALCGRDEVARRLLDKGAKVNARSQEGNTPLHIASTAGKLQIVQLLLDHGADPDTKGERGLTPFDAAKTRGHDAVVKLLLSKRGNAARRFELPVLRKGLSIF